MYSALVNLDRIDDRDVSSLYKGIKNEYLEDVITKEVYYNKNKYYIVKYDKSKLTNENIFKNGLFRSVISRDGKVLSFAPPKSLKSHHFKELYDFKDCYIEEFVEGTMINVFYDKEYEYENEKEREKGKWVISTKSNIGAKNSFFTTGHINKEDTFEYMFYDTCKACGLDFDMLDKQYQYSFVMQHPKNRIVVNVKYPALYIISVNKIVNNVVSQVSAKYIFDKTKVKYPVFYDNCNNDWSTFNENSYFTNDYNNMGIVVVDRKSGNRTKFRNPKYEYVKMLRGNQPKSEFRYIELWQQHKIKEYLHYYPESKDLFDEYYKKLYKHVYTIYNNYVSCYILKHKELKQYPFEYRTHMYSIHQIYKESLKSYHKGINIHTVFEYIRHLPTPKIMFSLNYTMRPSKEAEVDTN